MKYTSGPWSIRGKLTIQDSKNKKVANMSVINSDKTNEEIEANARLIAAAPDMLEALKELNKEVRIAHADRNTLTPGCPVCDSIGKAEQAIAKAEGNG